MILSGDMSSKTGEVRHFALESVGGLVLNVERYGPESLLLLKGTIKEESTFFNCDIF